MACNVLPLSFFLSFSYFLIKVCTYQQGISKIVGRIYPLTVINYICYSIFVSVSQGGDIQQDNCIISLVRVYI